jgi:peptidoglycan L-alanyl-D-glutamate endopeptidase CwlK
LPLYNTIVDKVSKKILLSVFSVMALLILACNNEQAESSKKPLERPQQNKPKLDTDSVLKSDIDRFGNYLDSAFIRFPELPEEIKNSLDTVHVTYKTPQASLRKGILILHASLKEDIRNVFEDLLALGYPVNSILPMSQFNWDDLESMRSNNTSMFNFRRVMGTRKLSDHAYGRALDINPLANPYFKFGKMLPENGYYECDSVQSICSNDTVVALFKSYNWNWGGYWKFERDYQHFYKR